MGISEEYETPDTVKVIRIVAFAFILLVIALASFVQIDAGHRGVVLKLGAVEDRIFAEGFHIKTPFIESVQEMSVQTQAYETSASAATSDLLDVTTKVTTNYHLEPSMVNKIYQQIGIAYELKVISPAVQETVKSVTAKYTADKLVTERTAVKEQIEAALKERLAPLGIVVETISIVDLLFPESFNNAITAKQTAVQDAIKAQNKLEQIKFEAQQAVATATGKADSAVIEAKGQADAIKYINEQLTQSPQYVNYLAVKTWDGKLPQVTGGAIPLINLPAGNTTVN